jgi:hypothetical protein
VSGFLIATIVVASSCSSPHPVSEARATTSRSNDGDFPAMNLKKTGKKVSLPYIEIDRFEGGKEGWLVFDTTLFSSQLGLK